MFDRYFSTPTAARLAGLPVPTLRAFMRAGLVRPALPMTEGATHGHGWNLLNIAGLACLRNLRKRGIPVEVTARVAQAISEMCPDDVSTAFGEGRHLLLFICQPAEVFPRLLSPDGVKASIPDLVDHSQASLGVCVVDLKAAVAAVEAAIKTIKSRRSELVSAREAQ